jgi:rfaE bifunctional protein kinase chain/domain/rfaE bifunctional protein nucleotidyltransferase chain/domain
MATHHKTCSLDSLLSIRREACASGKTVVHCHGCFDIVHPGHIQYLEFAKSLGDVLIVSVSSDTHVNKGPSRPLIPDDLRASTVAALQCVDWVYINSDPTAVELINALRPDVYVKGREYEKNLDARFLLEREAVIRNGGRVVFSTGDVVYSSSELISAIGRPDRFNDEKVARLRQRYGLSSSHLTNLLLEGRGMRIVVVGDYLLDRYHFCEATGVAGEAPMLSLRSLREQDYDGGAGVIALHLAGLGAKPILVSGFADDDLSRHADLRLKQAGVEVQCPRVRRGSVIKHRYMVEQTKMFKVDEGSTAPADSRHEDLLAARILAAAEGSAAVVFADFGYGVITTGLLDRILPALRPQVSVLSADVSGKRSNLLRFRSVDLLCPTEREVREVQHDYSGGLGAVVWNLLTHTGARQAMVTLGKQGLVTFDRNEQAADERLRSEYLPALSNHAVDPLGCGDALLAAATLTLAAGGNLQAAAFLGSIAAAIEVEQIGNIPVSIEQVFDRISRADAPVEGEDRITPSAVGRVAAA